MIYKLLENYFDLNKLELVSDVFEGHDWYHDDNSKLQRKHLGYYFEYQVNGKIYNTLPYLTRIKIDKLRSDLITEWQKSKGKK